jgi:predicted CXXCH cytochrome family protein
MAIAGASIALAALALAAPAAPRTPAAAYDGSGCGGCHASLFAAKSQHGAGACSECHAPRGKRGKCRGPIAGAWRLVAPEPQLCATCHAEVNAKHGACTSCHDPHASDHPSHLARWPVVALCSRCHDRLAGGKSVHTPVREGDCLGCHEPHSSTYPSLLRAANDARLCFRCHEDDVTGRASVHPPVIEGMCGECHAPHAAEHRGNLRSDGERACLGCHDGIAKGRNKHPVLELEGCTACHDAHGSGHRVLLLDEVNPLCQRCHPDRADGMHVTTFVRGGHRTSGVPDPHAPDRPMSCASCHSPHASDSPKLLRFGDSAMQFCDWCHGDRSGAHPELKDIHRVKRPPKKGGGQDPARPPPEAPPR